MNTAVPAIEREVLLTCPEPIRECAYALERMQKIRIIDTDTTEARK